MFSNFPSAVTLTQTIACFGHAVFLPSESVLASGADHQCLLVFWKCRVA